MTAEVSLLPNILPLILQKNEDGLISSQLHMFYVLFMLPKGLLSPSLVQHHADLIIPTSAL